MARSVLGVFFLSFCLAGCGGESEALKVYTQFSNAMRKGKCDVLRSVSEGPALEDVTKFCAPAGVFFGKPLPSAASVAADMAATPQGIIAAWKTEIESSFKYEGDLVLEVAEKPTGRLARKSTLNTPPPPQYKTVTMSKASGSWKVKEVVNKP